MTKEEKERVKILHTTLGDKFSCNACKTQEATKNCKGCPIYIQSFSPD